MRDTAEPQVLGYSWGTCVTEPEAQPEGSAAHLTHVPELDGLRGIAALAVFCHHVLYTSVPYPERWNWFVLAASRVSQYGMWGVDLFFVLSGYLITSLLIPDKPHRYYFRNFYWKRALRIFPLYAVSLVCLAIFFPGSRRYALLAAVFAANFAQVFHISSAGPYWTLAIEEQFYLIWPQFVRRLTLEQGRKIAVGAAMGCLALRLIAAIFGHHNYQFTFFHSDGLALGALLAFQQVQPKEDERRNGTQVLWMLTAMGFLMTLLPFLIPSALPSESAMALSADAFQLSGISLLGYCIVAAAVRRSGARALAALRWRVLGFFGLTSYCFYMSHAYVMFAYDRLFGQLPTGHAALYAGRFLAVLGATVVLCLISRRLIELPAMSLRRYVLRRE